MTGVQQDGLLHKLIGQHQDKHSAKDLMPGHFPAAVVDHRTEKNDRRCSQQFCPMRCTEQREGAVIRPAFCLYKDIKHNEEVNELLKKGNQNLGLLGYTEHSQAHCVRVAETAAHILKKFGYPEHDIELARIAGYMHDIGNAINRSRHAEYGGLLANEILKQYDLSVPDRITIVSAISNHDESTGGAVDPISAALIIGDKTDVRRSRVREKPKASFDIHDRVNYAVTDQTLKINTEKKVISLNLQIDTDICSMYEYFEIFLQRMLMCRGAADMLGATFKLTANGAKVL